MRLVLILCVLVLTAGTLFLAMSTRPDQLQDSAGSNAATLALAEEVEMLQEEAIGLKAKNRAQLAELETLAADRNRLEEENQEVIAQLNALTMNVAELTAMNEAANDQISALRTERDLVMSEGGDSETTITELRQAIGEGQARIQALEAELVNATAEAESMIVRLAAAQSFEVEEPAASDAQIEELQQRINQISGALRRAEQRIATLQAEAERSSIEATTMTDQATTAESEIAALKAEIAVLTTLVEERDANIAALRVNAGPANSPTISSCTEQTNKIFAEQKLTFERGTATIADVSTPSLEQLINPAQQCADAGLIVEIGGHTDSQGGELSNQTLSEERARAVLDFLYAGGVPSVAMRAVGYGESEPIADNATSEGRSHNRRIAFEWQQP